MDRMDGVERTFISIAAVICIVPRQGRRARAALGPALPHLVDTQLTPEQRKQ